ncbi:hypothetical protein FGD77_02560 [Roseovarius sp. M141]|nr:hypothetical protein [Roseovarius sp. M141]
MACDPSNSFNPGIGKMTKARNCLQEFIT